MSLQSEPLRKAKYVPTPRRTLPAAMAPTAAILTPVLSRVGGGSGGGRCAEVEGGGVLVWGGGDRASALGGGTWTGVSGDSLLPAWQRLMFISARSASAAGGPYRRNAR